ncbi:MAG: hypothetical protein GC185_03810 [Alphaproteobacteria bacterium]|nr:hypothetical protein [Alphaproteobacteria bacterium]
MKTYTVTPEQSGSIFETVARRDTLGRAIAKLAEAHGVGVWFHDYKDPVAGAPVIMVECGDVLLEQIKKMSGVKSVEETSGTLETERNARIKKYFTAPSSPSPASPPKNPDPKKPAPRKPRGPGFFF